MCGEAQRMQELPGGEFHILTSRLLEDRLAWWANT